MFRRKLLQLAFPCALVLLFGSRSAAAQTSPSQSSVSGGDFWQIPLAKIPPGTIIVKGAEPSSSDRATPVPEDGGVSRNVYQNRYLGLSYPLPADWTESFKGPPPSDNGGYVLAQLVLSATFKGTSKGTVLISAQDMFFGLAPGHNALELIKFSKDHLPSYYEVERPPTDLEIAGRSFVRFDYRSPVADLHWYVLATQIRCHTVQFAFISQDARMLESLVQDMNRMQLPPEASAASGRGGGGSPICLADYAAGGNVIYKVDPVLEDHRFNAIPVRIIIGKNGKVQHVHMISAFPDQAAKITEALLQWTFKPYMRDGQAVEVETGIMFGFARSRREQAVTSRPVPSTND